LAIVGRGKYDFDDRPRRTDVKLIRSAIFAGIAKKVIDEARKPQNQAKIKAYVQQAMDKKKGTTGGTAGRRPY
jgi:hypothetical protein